LACSVDLCRAPAGFLSSLSHLILPSVILGWFTLALVARITRSSMLEVLSQDYIRTARSKGLAERVVILPHAFRNALILLAPPPAAPDEQTSDRDHLRLGGIDGMRSRQLNLITWPSRDDLLIATLYSEYLRGSALFH
jgi:hypothetical protein